MDLKNRRGCIRVSRELMDTLDVKFFKLLFGNFYPINTETIGFNDILYFGYSEHFEKIEKGTIEPEYIATIHSDDNGEPKSIEFNKV